MKIFTLALSATVLFASSAFAGETVLLELSCSKNIETRELIEGGVNKVCFINILTDSRLVSRGISVKNAAGQMIYILKGGKGVGYNGGGSVRVIYQASFFGTADLRGNVRELPEASSTWETKVAFFRDRFPGSHRVASIEMPSLKAIDFDDRELDLGL